MFRIHETSATLLSRASLADTTANSEPLPPGDNARLQGVTGLQIELTTGSGSPIAPFAAAPSQPDLQGPLPLLRVSNAPDSIGLCHTGKPVACEGQLNCSFEEDAPRGTQYDNFRRARASSTAQDVDAGLARPCMAGHPARNSGEVVVRKLPAHTQAPPQQAISPVRDPLPHKQPFLGSGGVGPAKGLQSCQPNLLKLPPEVAQKTHPDHAPQTWPSAQEVLSTKVPPRHARERGLPYGRRIHAAQPELAIEDISQLSGVSVRLLRQDPAFRAPGAALNALRNQVPGRYPREANQAYARRIHQVLPDLAIKEVSALSGASVSHLRDDPAFQSHDEALRTLRALVPPRHDREPSLSYARRILRAAPDLALKDVSKLSGATVGHLRQDLAFRTPRAPLVPQGSVPLRNEGERNLPYARRIRAVRPDLALEDISKLSGAAIRNLRQDPTFQPSNEALQALRRQVPPRRVQERNQTYARRIRSAHPELGLEEISLLSGVTLGDLRKDPTLQATSEALLALCGQVPPRQEGERNLPYARRIHAARPDLAIEDVSSLSSAMVAHLRKDPAFQASSEALLALRGQVPPRQEGERNLPYARRLHAARPELPLEDVSKLSGVIVGDLRKDPTFQASSEALLALRGQVPPRQEGERNLPYARRIHAARPDLANKDVSKLSNAMVAHLRQDPAFQTPGQALLALRARVPLRQEGERNLPYARRICQALPDLAIEDVSQLSGTMATHLRRQLACGRVNEQLQAIHNSLPRQSKERGVSYAMRLAAHERGLTLGQLALLTKTPKAKLNTNLNLQALLAAPSAPPTMSAPEPTAADLLTQAMDLVGLERGEISTPATTEWGEWFDGLSADPLDDETTAAEALSPSELMSFVDMDSGLISYPAPPSTTAALQAPQAPQAMDWEDLEDFFASSAPGLSTRWSARWAEPASRPPGLPLFSPAVTGSAIQDDSHAPSIEQQDQGVESAVEKQGRKRVGGPHHALVPTKLARGPEQDLSFHIAGTLPRLQAKVQLKGHLSVMAKAEDKVSARLGQGGLDELDRTSEIGGEWTRHIEAWRGWNACDGMLTFRRNYARERLTIEAAVVVPGREYAVPAMLERLRKDHPTLQQSFSPGVWSYAKELLSNQGLMPSFMQGAAAKKGVPQRADEAPALATHQEAARVEPSVYLAPTRAAQQDTTSPQRTAFQELQEHTHQLRHAPWSLEVQESCFKLLARHPAWPRQQPLSYFTDAEGFDRAMVRDDLPVRVVLVMDNLCVVQGAKIKQVGFGEQACETALAMVLGSAGGQSLRAALAEGMPGVSSAMPFCQLLRQGLAAHLARHPEVALAALRAPMPEPGHYYAPSTGLSETQSLARFDPYRCNAAGAWAQEVRRNSASALVQDLCERLLTRLPVWKQSTRLHILTEDADGPRDAYLSGRRIAYNPLLSQGVVSITRNEDRTIYGATDGECATSFTLAVPAGMHDTLFNALALTLKPWMEIKDPKTGDPLKVRVPRHSIEVDAEALKENMARFIETHEAEVRRHIEELRPLHVAALARSREYDSNEPERSSRATGLDDSGTNSLAAN
jgi:hypothetical protein